MGAIVLLLVLLPGQHEAVLKWNPSDQVVNYRVHRSTSQNGPFPIIASGIKVTHWTDKTVQAGQTYYYVVDCRNPETNLVSTFSNEVKAVIP
jgi:fibronectin type 3 domain-containing protein